MTEPLSGLSVFALVSSLGVTVACLLIYFLVSAKARPMREFKASLILALGVTIPVSALAIIAYLVLQ